MLINRYHRQRQRGDTLIEVLLAMAVLSIVTVGAFAAMSKGDRIAYASLERSQVRSELNRQIELLQYYRDSYLDWLRHLQTAPTTPITPAAALWQDRIRLHDSITGPDTCAAQVGIEGVSPYYFVPPDSSSSEYQYKIMTQPPSNTKPADGLPTPGDGIWIESNRFVDTAPVIPSAPKPSYVDAAVKACWQSAAGSQIETMSSTVRLYDR